MNTLLCFHYATYNFAGRAIKLECMCEHEREGEGGRERHKRISDMKQVSQRIKILCNNPQYNNASTMKIYL